jgi:hypothetical protein
MTHDGTKVKETSPSKKVREKKHREEIVYAVVFFFNYLEKGICVNHPINMIRLQCFVGLTITNYDY